ncbi:hypothetical protein QE390_002012 [Siphonobacter sp. SORGH_AS 1065]|nr:hypothetical protein [Siphonobacter sp. SORGH_AS_1065]
MIFRISNHLPWLVSSPTSMLLVMAVEMPVRVPGLTSGAIDIEPLRGYDSHFQTSYLPL